MEWLSITLVLSALLVALNWYFYGKVARFADGFVPRWRRFVPAFFAVMNAPYLLLTGTYIFGHRLHDLPEPLLKVAVYPFYAWSTTLLAVLLLTAPKDLAVGLGRGLLWIWRRLRPEPKPLEPTMAGVTRRGFFSAAAAVVPPLVYGFSAHGLYAGHDLEVSPEIPVGIPGLPRAFDGLRITQISDLHVGAYIREREMAEVIEQVNRIKGDLLVLTGDILDSSLEMLPVAQAAVAQLRAPLGVYGILGNHDYYADRPARCMHIMEGMRQAGVRMLRNSRTELAENGERLILAGVDWTGAQRGNPIMYNSIASRHALDQTFHGAEPGLVRILLAHHPHHFLEAQSYHLDLTLSGHTHGGGQVVVAEYNGRPIAIGSAIFRYVSGLYQENGRTLYVNRGVGYVGLPMRINCPPEISRFRLVATGRYLDPRTPQPRA